ncbi:hypothetical protein CYMTET_49605 [Cymbomonas tetramitiformis]|uniref:Uncharacterized protein n=1 Tax=Cymbomonas tetramitiformis TaxID=36881 RepID=A0AAE0ETQ8_9CHLO|nr:hypothetical protein CYMTET_49605 [Cymbomonas tetramitiformis]
MQAQGESGRHSLQAFISGLEGLSTEDVRAVMAQLQDMGAREKGHMVASHREHIALDSHAAATERGNAAGSHAAANENGNAAGSHAAANENGNAAGSHAADNENGNVAGSHAAATEVGDAAIEGLAQLGHFLSKHEHEAGGIATGVLEIDAEGRVAIKAQEGGSEVDESGELPAPSIGEREMQAAVEKGEPPPDRVPRSRASRAVSRFDRKRVFTALDSCRSLLTETIQKDTSAVTKIASITRSPKALRKGDEKSAPGEPFKEWSVATAHLRPHESAAAIALRQLGHTHGAAILSVIPPNLAAQMLMLYADGGPKEMSQVLVEMKQMNEYSAMLLLKALGAKTQEAIYGEMETLQMADLRAELFLLTQAQFIEGAPLSEALQVMSTLDSTTAASLLASMSDGTMRVMMDGMSEYELERMHKPIVCDLSVNKAGRLLDALARNPADRERAVQMATEMDPERRAAVIAQMSAGAAAAVVAALPEPEGKQLLLALPGRQGLDILGELAENHPEKFAEVKKSLGVEGLALLKQRANPQAQQQGAAAGEGSTDVSVQAKLPPMITKWLALTKHPDRAQVETLFGNAVMEAGPELQQILGTAVKSRDVKDKWHFNIDAALRGRTKVMEREPSLEEAERLKALTNVPNLGELSLEKDYLLQHESLQRACATLSQHGQNKVVEAVHASDTALAGQYHAVTRAHKELAEVQHNLHLADVPVWQQKLAINNVDLALQRMSDAASAMHSNLKMLATTAIVDLTAMLRANYVSTGVSSEGVSEFLQGLLDPASLKMVSNIEGISALASQACSFLRKKYDVQCMLAEIQYDNEFDVDDIDDLSTYDDNVFHVLVSAPAFPEAVVGQYLPQVFDSDPYIVANTATEMESKDRRTVPIMKDSIGGDEQEAGSREVYGVISIKSAGAANDENSKAKSTDLAFMIDGLGSAINQVLRQEAAAEEKRHGQLLAQFVRRFRALPDANAAQDKDETAASGGEEEGWAKSVDNIAWLGTQKRSLEKQIKTKTFMHMISELKRYSSVSPAVVGVVASIMMFVDRSDFLEEMLARGLPLDFPEMMRQLWNFTRQSLVMPKSSEKQGLLDKMISHTFKHDSVAQDFFEHFQNRFTREQVKKASRLANLLMDWLIVIVEASRTHSTKEAIEKQHPAEASPDQAQSMNAIPAIPVKQASKVQPGSGRESTFKNAKPQASRSVLNAV